MRESNVRMTQEGWDGDDRAYRKVKKCDSEIMSTDLVSLLFSHDQGKSWISIM